MIARNHAGFNPDSLARKQSGHVRLARARGTTLAAPALRNPLREMVAPEGIGEASSSALIEGN